MLARKTLLILGTNAIGAFTGALTLFFIGRYMTPSAYGMFGFAIGAIGIMVFLADIGFDRAHMKRVSEGRPLGDCMKTYLYGKATLVFGFTTIALSAILLWHHLIGFTDAVTLPVLLVVLLFYVATEFRKFFEVTYNALRQTARTQLLNLVEYTIKTPILILVALAFGYASGRWVPFQEIAERVAAFLGVSDGVSTSNGAVMIASGWAIAMAVSALMALFLFVYHDFPMGRFRKDLLKDYIRFALPIALPAALAIMAVRVDSVMIGYFWSDRDVGHYFAGQRIMTMLMVLPNAVGTLFFPLISELSRERQKGAVREIGISTQRIVSLVMVPAVMVLIVFAEEAIHIFLSDSYLPAANILRVLGLYALLVSFTLVAGSIVGGFDHPEKGAIAGMVNMTVNLSLNFILIPASILGVPLLGLKGTGAAIATLAGQLAGFSIVSYYAWKYTDGIYIRSAVGKHVLTAALVGTFLHFAQGPLFGGTDRVFELVLALAVGGVLYLLLLMAMREVGRKDYLMVLDIINPVKMAGYVRTELTGRGQDEPDGDKDSTSGRRGRDRR